MLMAAAKAALSPTLSIMQSIIADQASRQWPDQQGAYGKTPNVAVTPGYSTQATQKLTAYYFDDHQSATEVRAKVFQYLAQYLGKQIDAVENEIAGKPAGDTPSASKELTDSLKDMDAEVRGSLRTALTDFAEGEQSLQATAIRMLTTLDLDVLSKDMKITQYLEQMIGFDLNGMSAQDILKSFADPDGKENDKLRSIVSNALAGEHGSKTMQRLDDASKGLRSVEETKRDIADAKPYDEVDEETEEEDKKDIKAAKAYETLNETRDFIDAVAEENVELAEAKAAIEAANGASKPAEPSTVPASEQSAGSEASEADGEKDADAEGAWDSWEPAGQTGNPHSETKPLYL